MLNWGWLLREVLPDSLHWIGAITDLIGDVVLACADGWFEDDVALIRAGIETIFSESEIRPEELESIIHVATIIAEDLATLHFLNVARAREITRAQKKRMKGAGL